MTGDWVGYLGHEAGTCGTVKYLSTWQVEDKMVDTPPPIIRLSKRVRGPAIVSRRCGNTGSSRPVLDNLLSSTTTTHHPIITTTVCYQIYSTSASPRYLNTPISVRRHLCRPSLPMSIENLKSYGQLFSYTTQTLPHKDPAPSATHCL